MADELASRQAATNKGFSYSSTPYVVAPNEIITFNDFQGGTIAPPSVNLPGSYLNNECIADKDVVFPINVYDLYVVRKSSLVRYTSPGGVWNSAITSNVSWTNFANQTTSSLTQDDWATIPPVDQLGSYLIVEFILDFWISTHTTSAGALDFTTLSWLTIPSYWLQPWWTYPQPSYNSDSFRKNGDKSWTLTSRYFWNRNDVGNQSVKLGLDIRLQASGIAGTSAAKPFRFENTY